MTKSDKLDEYARLLRYAWLNPSDPSVSAAVHAFEHANVDFLEAFLERVEGRDLSAYTDTPEMRHVLRRGR